MCIGVRHEVVCLDVTNPMTFDLVSNSASFQHSAAVETLAMILKTCIHVDHGLHQRYLMMDLQSLFT